MIDLLAAAEKVRLATEPTCHFCGFPVTGKRIHSIRGAAVAHFECWYEGGAYGVDWRDPATGELCRREDRR